MKSIAMIPGDGVGIEVAEVVRAVLMTLLQRTGKNLQIDDFDLSGERYLKTGECLSEAELERIAQHEAIFFGAIGHPRVPAGILEQGILLKLRFALDLFVNLRPIKLLDTSLCPLKGVQEEDLDLLVVRENTEGIYIGSGGVLRKGTEQEVAIQEDVNTYYGVERIIEVAFQEAKKRKRQRVLMADKSNVLTFAHGLWQRVFQQKRQAHSEVEAQHMYIDALSMALVRDPSVFEVIVTNNLFGDIITDLGAQLQGGMGMAASANIHPKKIGMFEPVHGSAPDIAGKGLANPYAAVLSLVQLLSFIGLDAESEVVEKAVARGIKDGMRTKDIGGNCSTEEIAAYLCHLLLEMEAP